jgi:hypothetical protein
VIPTSPVWQAAYFKPQLLPELQFDTDRTTGLWDGTSGYFNYTVTVANDGNSFTGKENFTFEVPGTNPYAGGGTSFSGFTLSATKIEVDKSLLP